MLSSAANIIVVALVSVICDEIAENPQTPNWYITGKGWRELQEAQYYTCGFTITSQKSDIIRGSPWFCINNQYCKSVLGPTPLYAPSKQNYTCDNLRYNQRRDTCCHISNIDPPMNVMETAFSVFNVVKNLTADSDVVELSANEFKTQLFEEHIAAENDTGKILENVLDTHEICGLVPSNKRDYMTLYEPYICVENGTCSTHYPIYVRPRFGWTADILCKQRGLDKKKTLCCHVSGAVDKSYNISEWNFKAFKPDQKFVAGFRANVMCEQYNRLICTDDDFDSCTLRVADRYYAQPGEFPHQALVGVLSHRVQFFHCAGSIISKNFIISAYGCKTYDGILANIVLVGDFIFPKYNEKFSEEMITYVKQHYTDLENHSLLLLKLLRPLNLTAFVRPACVNFHMAEHEISAKYSQFLFGYITGYGPVARNSQFNYTLKRLQFEYDWKLPLKNCRVGDRGSSYESSHLCLDNAKRFLLYDYIERAPGNASGFFDMGAPFSILAPYCSWLLYGVTVQEQKYSTHPPTLVETLPRAMDWIENIVWNDFDLFDLNMSLPGCADGSNPEFHHYAGFNLFPTLRQEYNTWYIHDY